MRTSPNFLIIGAEKSGTTWLYNKLRDHPQIYLPLTKECHFFNRYNSNLEVNNNYEKLGWEWYCRFFENIPEEVKAQGEVTPMYLCDPLAPERIAKDLPNVKLIYILRNPIERAYSHYWMAFRKGHVDRSFEVIVAEKDPKIIKRGKYSKQLEKYYSLFPKENLRGYIYESFFQKPYHALRDIHAFLNVDKQSYPKNSESKKILAAPKPKSKLFHQVIAKTAKKMRKHSLTFDLLDWLKKTGAALAIKEWNTGSEPYPPMKESIFYQLLEYYLHDIEKLETSFNFNLDCWKNYSK